MNQKWQRSENRKKNRLQEFNYSHVGFYFVTLCIKNREYLFGEIINEKMVLNSFGIIAKQCWRDIPKHFKAVKIEAFIMMPNHIHGIIKIGDPYGFKIRKGRRSASPTDRTKMLLPKIIQQFKSTVTRKIHLLNSNTSFQWQRSYYDHIIQNEESLEKIRKYIQMNPQQWKDDNLFID